MGFEHNSSASDSTLVTPIKRERSKRRILPQLKIVEKRSNFNSSNESLLLIYRNRKRDETLTQSTDSSSVSRIMTNKGLRKKKNVTFSSIQVVEYSPEEVVHPSQEKKTKKENVTCQCVIF